MAFMSAITRLVATQRIARSIGGEGDSGILTACQDALSEAFSEWNNRRNWYWTLTQAADITVVVGTADYDLPADFKSFYDVRTTTNQRTLHYLDLREYDKKRVDQTASGVPVAYTLIYDTETTPAPIIRLLPTPQAADVLVVRYYRLLAAPATDGATLDIPSKYENGLLWLAKALYLADRDAENARTGFWAQKAEQILRKAVDDEESIPDREERFIPAAEHARPVYDATHPYYYLDQD